MPRCRTLSTTICTAIVIAGIAPAAQKKTPAPNTVAQELVTRFAAAHTDDLSALELALNSTRGCKTVAATHIEDIGGRCDDDENAAMRSGQPYVEAPTKEDPVYDVTQPLHDSSGKLIGAVGMDLKPAGRARDAIVSRARELLGQLEAQISTAQKLLERPAR